jgi:hypothetical protein
MDKKLIREMVKHVAAIAFLAVIALIYFKPLLDGKDVKQSDMTHFEGMSKEVRDFHDQTGQYSYWANNMFSGMPSTMVYGESPSSVFHWISSIIYNTVPMRSYGPILAMLICFYLTMILLGFDIWIAIGSALAFAFCSYNPIIIEAGHVTKAYAIATIPLIVGGAIMAYQGRIKGGAVLFMIGFGLSIAQSHPQVTYYSGIAVVLFILTAFIYACVEKSLPQFFKTSAALLIAGILAILPNIANLYQTYDYSKETMRSPSELVKQQTQSDVRSTGLEYNYAYTWSYGLGESFSLLVPNIMGGSSHIESMEQYEKQLPHVLQTLTTQRFDKDPNQLMQDCTSYWGAQPFTSGPVYAGAIICLLFVISLCVIKGRMRVWIILLFAVSLFMAWGKHFPLLNDLLFYHLPLYNKFRTPSMILLLTTFIMALSAFWGLKELLTGKIAQQKLLKYIYVSTAIVGGLCLLFAVMPGLFFDFTTPANAGLPAPLLSALQEDRQALCSSDAWRSLGFVLITALFLWLFAAKKLNAKFTTAIVIAISVLSLIDLWNVDKRYLNDKDFEKPAATLASNYVMHNANRIIKQDTSLGYRVLNLAANPFADSHTPYYHHSVGGYHPAKLRRYQEMVDSVLSRDINQFISSFNNVYTNDSLRDAFMQSLPAINMLNAKYFIFDPNNPPFLNTAALGAAWFVDHAGMADNANEELSLLQSVNPAQTAVINKDFSGMLKGWKEGKSARSTITLTQKTSNTCVYKTQTDKEELAVFSEIYYPQFWHIDIDGKPAQMLRANYVLRAMLVPSGEHTITFTFYPDSWVNSRRIALGGSCLVIVILLGMGGLYLYRKRKPTNATVLTKQP